MNPVIQVNEISKSYDISHQTRKAGYSTLKDDFTHLFKRSFGGGSPDEHETFWALKDISFQVNQGEALGVIGKNGSGKSTLLKILSRIVDPTTGTIRMQGKVASLLEVGTGFHPELTGRENIYFNGSMIGMSRQEIKQKFKQIVEFSEVERFLDTPVKFYSSGMYVRLAFSVAAHLESDILILDEVLAVGDAQFQKKSLNKMMGILKEGRTILFVSHSMGSVKEICDKTILLDKGRIKAIGETETIANQYLNLGLKKNSVIEFEDPLPGNRKVKLLGGSVKKTSGNISSDFDVTEPIIVEFDIKVLDSNAAITPNIHVKNSEGLMVFVSSDQTSRLGRDHKHPKGIHRKRCIIPANLLSCGTYYVGLAASTMSPLAGHFFEQDTLAFTIEENTANAKKSSRGNFSEDIPGYIRPLLEWESIKI